MPDAQNFRLYDYNLEKTLIKFVQAKKLHKLVLKSTLLRREIRTSEKFAQKYEENQKGALIARGADRWKWRNKEY